MKIITILKSIAKIQKNKKNVPIKVHNKFEIQSNNCTN